MNDATKRGDDFLDALAQFERCLETPVIPGELESWLQAASDACQIAGDLFKTHVGASHREDLREIARQDLELAPRIDELKAEHQSLLAKWDDVRDMLARLREQAERAEPHESKLDGRRERFTEHALALVIDARKHEIALATWFLESFHRDRGVVD